MVHSGGVYLNYKWSCFQLFPTIFEGVGHDLERKKAKKKEAKKKKKATTVFMMKKAEELFK